MTSLLVTVALAAVGFGGTYVSFRPRFLRKHMQRGTGR